MEFVSSSPEKTSGQQNAVEAWPEILDKVLQGRRPVLFLDYDGTLAPIVANPEKAYMEENMRDALRRAAEGPGKITTAIISGRSREKVQNFVQLEGLFYAGSHGFDISGPSSHNMNASSESNENTDKSINEDPSVFAPSMVDAIPRDMISSMSVGDSFRPLLEAVRGELEDAVKFIPGAEVEDNKFALSVHYRNVIEEEYEPVKTKPLSSLGSLDVSSNEVTNDGGGVAHTTPLLSSSTASLMVPPADAGPAVLAIFDIVNNQLLKNDCLECRHGKKVLEIRLKIKWDKGSAVLWILKALGLASPSRPITDKQKESAEEGHRGEERDGSDDSEIDEEILYCDCSVCPIYIGDDITDEDAFLALKRLQQITPAESQKSKQPLDSNVYSEIQEINREGEGAHSQNGTQSPSTPVSGDEENRSINNNNDNLKNMIVGEKHMGSSGGGSSTGGGGFGVLVRRDNETERPSLSHASFRVKDPKQVRELIELITEAAARQSKDNTKC